MSRRSRKGKSVQVNLVSIFRYDVFDFVYAVFRGTITYHGNTSIRISLADTRSAMLEFARESCDCGEESSEDNTTDPELGTATNLIIGSRASNSTSARNDGVGKGKQQSAVHRNDAQKLVHGREIISQDGVSGKLGEEGHEGHHCESPSRVAVLDQKPVVEHA